MTTYYTLEEYLIALDTRRKINQLKARKDQKPSKGRKDGN